MGKFNLKNEKIGWLSILTLICTATFFVTNLRYTFWDFDLFPNVTYGIIAHYHFNYFDFGFIKRGLVGTFVKGIGMAPSLSIIKSMSFFIGLAICFVTAYFIYKLRFYFEGLAFYLFAGLLIFNPGTLANLGYDLGRYDQLLILCSVFSLYYIKRKDIFKVVALSVLALLIHELYIIMFFPILLYVSIFHSNFKFKQISYLLLAVSTVLGFLFFFGKIEAVSMQQIADITAYSNFDVSDYGIIWKRTLEENIQYTFEHVGAFHSGKIIELLLGAAFVLLVFMLLIMISTFNKIDEYGFLVIFVASIPIFFLAIDYSRWYSHMIINAFLYFIFLVTNRKQKKVQITKQHLTVISLILIIGIILGPIGITRSFPLFDIF